jgi:hypothetical protein
MPACTWYVGSDSYLGLSDGCLISVEIAHIYVWCFKPAYDENLVNVSDVVWWCRGGCNAWIHRDRRRPLQTVSAFEILNIWKFDYQNPSQAQHDLSNISITAWCDCSKNLERNNVWVCVWPVCVIYQCLTYLSPLCVLCLQFCGGVMNRCLINNFDVTKKMMSLWCLCDVSSVLWRWRRRVSVLSPPSTTYAPWGSGKTSGNVDISMFKHIIKRMYVLCVLCVCLVCLVCFVCSVYALRIDEMTIAW